MDGGKFPRFRQSDVAPMGSVPDREDVNAGRESPLMVLNWEKLIK
jgi:hypothetical protein